MAEKVDQVLVISQVGERGTEIRKRADIIADLIVKPVATEFGLQTVRSDRDPTPGPITPQILRSILSSRVVVADLTGRNPNVYYELCFAQSFGVPAVMVVDKSSSLPFDVKDERVITIGDEGAIDMEQGEKVKKGLEDALKVALEEDYIPNSIITEIAGVQSIESMSPDNPVASELATLNRRVDQIYERLPAPRSEGSTYKGYDLKQMMDLTWLENMHRKQAQYLTQTLGA